MDNTKFTIVCKLLRALLVSPFVTGFISLYNKSFRHIWKDLFIRHLLCTWESRECEHIVPLMSTNKLICAHTYVRDSEVLRTRLFSNLAYPSARRLRQLSNGEDVYSKRKIHVSLPYRDWRHLGNHGTCPRTWDNTLLVDLCKKGATRSTFFINTGWERELVRWGSSDNLDLATERSSKSHASSDITFFVYSELIAIQSYIFESLLCWWRAS